MRLVQESQQQLKWQLKSLFRCVCVGEETERGGPMAMGGLGERVGGVGWVGTEKLEAFLCLQWLFVEWVDRAKGRIVWHGLHVDPVPFSLMPALFFGTSTLVFSPASPGQF